MMEAGGEQVSGPDLPYDLGVGQAPRIIWNKETVIQTCEFLESVDQDAWAIAFVRLEKMVSVLGVNHALCVLAQDRLCALLGSPDPETLHWNTGVRLSVMRTLLVVMPPGEKIDTRVGKGMDAVLGRLGDQCWEVRQAAVHTLDKLSIARGDKELVHWICERILTSKQWAAREGGLDALRALARIGDLQVLERICARLSDEQMWVRAAAVRALDALCCDGGVYRSVLVELVRVARTSALWVVAGNKPASARANGVRARVLRTVGRLLGGEGGCYSGYVSDTFYARVEVKLVEVVYMHRTGVHGGGDASKDVRVRVRLGETRQEIGVGEVAFLRGSTGGLVEVEGIGVQARGEVCGVGASYGLVPSRNVRVELWDVDGSVGAVVVVALCVQADQEGEDASALWKARDQANGAWQAVGEANAEIAVEGALKCLDDAGEEAQSLSFEALRVVGLGAGGCSPLVMIKAARAACAAARASDVLTRAGALDSLLVLVRLLCASGFDVRISATDAYTRLFKILAGGSGEKLSAKTLKEWLNAVHVSAGAGTSAPAWAPAGELSQADFVAECVKRSLPACEDVRDVDKLQALADAASAAVECLPQARLRHHALLVLNAASSFLHRIDALPCFLSTAFTSISASFGHTNVRSWTPISLRVELLLLSMTDVQLPDDLVLEGSMQGHQVTEDFSLKKLAKPGATVGLTFKGVSSGSLDINIRMWSAETTANESKGMTDKSNGMIFGSAQVSVHDPQFSCCYPPECVVHAPKQHISLVLTKANREGVHSDVGKISVSVQHLAMMQTGGAQQGDLRLGDKAKESDKVGGNAREDALVALGVVTRVLSTQVRRSCAKDLKEGGLAYAQLAREHGIPGVLPPHKNVYSHALSAYFAPIQGHFVESLDATAVCLGLDLITMLVRGACRGEIGVNSEIERDLVVSAARVCVRMVESHEYVSGVAAAGAAALSALVESAHKDVWSRVVQEDEGRQVVQSVGQTLAQAACDILRRYRDLVGDLCGIAASLEQSAYATGPSAHGNVEGVGVGDSKSKPFQIDDTRAADDMNTESTAELISANTHEVVRIVPDDYASLREAVVMTVNNPNAVRKQSSGTRLHVLVRAGRHYVGLVEISQRVLVVCEEGAALYGCLRFLPGGEGGLEGGTIFSYGGPGVLVDGGQWVLRGCRVVAGEARVRQRVPEPEVLYKALFKMLDVEQRGVLSQQQVNNWLSDACGWNKGQRDELWAGEWKELALSGGGVGLDAFVHLVGAKHLPVGVLSREEEKEMMRARADKGQEMADLLEKGRLDAGGEVGPADGACVWCCGGHVTLLDCELGGATARTDMLTRTELSHKDDGEGCEADWGLVAGGACEVHVVKCNFSRVRHAAACLQNQARLVLTATHVQADCGYALRYARPVCKCMFAGSSRCPAYGRVAAVSVNASTLNTQHVWMDSSRPVVYAHTSERSILEGDVLDMLPSHQVLSWVDTLRMHGEKKVMNETSSEELCELLMREYVPISAFQDNSASKAASGAGAGRGVEGKMVQRTLSVADVEVDELRVKDWWFAGGKADPYIVFSCAGKQGRTEWKKNTLSARWEAVGWKFHLQKVGDAMDKDKDKDKDEDKVRVEGGLERVAEAGSSHSSHVRVDVYDHDLITKDDIIGSAVVPLSLLEQAGPAYDMWVSLIDWRRAQTAGWGETDMAWFVAETTAADVTAGSAAASKHNDGAGDRNILCLNAAVARVDASSQVDACEASCVFEQGTEVFWRPQGSAVGAWLCAYLCDTFEVFSISLVANVEEVSVECGGKAHKITMQNGEHLLTFGGKHVTGDSIKITILSLPPEAINQDTHAHDYSVCFRSVVMMGRSTRGRVRLTGRMDKENTFRAEHMVDSSALVRNIRNSAVGVLGATLALVRGLSREKCTREEVSHTTGMIVVDVVKMFAEEGGVVREGIGALANLCEDVRYGVRVAEGWAQREEGARWDVVRGTRFAWLCVEEGGLDQRKGSFGKFDPYVVVSGLRRTARTPTESNTLQPLWLVETVVPVGGEADKVMIALWDKKDKRGEDDLIGQGMLVVREGGEVWLDLRDPLKGGAPVCGQVKIRYERETIPRKEVARVGDELMTALVHVLSLYCLPGGAAHASGTTKGTRNGAPSAMSGTMIGASTGKAHRPVPGVGDKRMYEEVVMQGLALLRALSQDASLKIMVCDCKGMLGMLTSATRAYAGGEGDDGYAAAAALVDEYFRGDSAGHEGSLATQATDVVQVTREPAADVLATLREGFVAGREKQPDELLEEVEVTYSAWGGLKEGQRRTSTTAFLKDQELAYWLMQSVDGAEGRDSEYRPWRSWYQTINKYLQDRRINTHMHTSGRKRYPIPRVLDVRVEGFLHTHTQMESGNSVCVVITCGGDAKRTGVVVDGAGGRGSGSVGGNSASQAADATATAAAADSAAIASETGAAAPSTFPPTSAAKAAGTWAAAPLRFEGVEKGAEIMIHVLDSRGVTGAETLVGRAVITAGDDEAEKEGIWVDLTNAIKDRTNAGQAPSELEQAAPTVVGRLRVRQEWVDPLGELIQARAKQGTSVLPTRWSAEELWDASHDEAWPMPWRVNQGGGVSVRLARAHAVKLKEERGGKGLGGETVEVLRETWVRTRIGPDAGDELDGIDMVKMMDELVAGVLDVRDNQLMAPAAHTLGTTKLFLLEGSMISDGTLLQIEDEIVEVLQGGGSDVVSVARAQKRTHPTLHPVGTVVHVLKDYSHHIHARIGGDAVIYTKRRAQAVGFAGGINRDREQAQPRTGISAGEWPALLARIASKADYGDAPDVQALGEALAELCSERWLTCLQLLDVMSLVDQVPAARALYRKISELGGKALAGDFGGRSVLWRGLVVEKELSLALIQRHSHVLREARDGRKEGQIHVRVVAVCGGAHVSRGLVRSSVECGPFECDSRDGATPRTWPKRTRETSWAHVQYPTRLRVRVVGASGLPRTDSLLAGGKADTCCCIKLGSREARTRVQKSTLSPKWGEEFVFPCQGYYHCMLVRVIDHERGGKSSSDKGHAVDGHVIGEGKLHVTPSERVRDVWVRLKTKGGTSAGCVRVMIENYRPRLVRDLDVLFSGLKDEHDGPLDLVKRVLCVYGGSRRASRVLCEMMYGGGGALSDQLNRQPASGVDDWVGVVCEVFFSTPGASGEFWDRWRRMDVGTGERAVADFYYICVAAGVEVQTVEMETDTMLRLFLLWCMERGRGDTDTHKQADAGKPHTHTYHLLSTLLASVIGDRQQADKVCNDIVHSCEGLFHAPATKPTSSPASTSSGDGNTHTREDSRVSATSSELLEALARRVVLDMILCGGCEAQLNQVLSLPAPACMDMLPSFATLRVQLRIASAITCTASIPLQLSDLVGCGPVWVRLREDEAWHPPMCVWSGTALVDVQYDGVTQGTLESISDEAEAGLMHVTPDIRLEALRLLQLSTCASSPLSRARALEISARFLTDQDWRVCAEAVSLHESLLSSDSALSRHVVQNVLRPWLASGGLGAARPSVHACRAAVRAEIGSMRENSCTACIESEYAHLAEACDAWEQRLREAGQLRASLADQVLLAEGITQVAVSSLSSALVSHTRPHSRAYAHPPALLAHTAYVLGRAAQRGDARACDALTRALWYQRMASFVSRSPEDVMLVPIKSLMPAPPQLRLAGIHVSKLPCEDGARVYCRVRSGSNVWRTDQRVVEAGSAAWDNVFVCVMLTKGSTNGTIELWAVPSSASSSSSSSSSSAGCWTAHFLCAADVIASGSDALRLDLRDSRGLQKGSIKVTYALGSGGAGSQPGGDVLALLSVEEVADGMGLRTERVPNRSAPHALRLHKKGLPEGAGMAGQGSDVGRRLVVGLTEHESECVCLTLLSALERVAVEGEALSINAACVCLEHDSEHVRAGAVRVIGQLVGGAVGAAPAGGVAWHWNFNDGVSDRDAERAGRPDMAHAARQDTSWLVRWSSLAHAPPHARAQAINPFATQRDAEKSTLDALLDGTRLTKRFVRTGPAPSGAVSLIRGLNGATMPPSRTTPDIVPMDGYRSPTRYSATPNSREMLPKLPERFDAGQAALEVYRSVSGFSPTKSPSKSQSDALPRSPMESPDKINSDGLPRTSRVPRRQSRPI